MGCWHGLFRNIKLVQLGEEMTLLQDKRRIRERWVRFFRSLLNAKSDILDHDIQKRLPKQPVASALETEPTEEEVATAMKAMANTKAVGPDGLPGKLLKLGQQQDRIIFLEFQQLVTLIRREERFPRQWKDAVIIVLYNKDGKTECANYHGISLVSHVGKVPLRGVARRLSPSCVAKGLLTEEQCGFQPDRSTTYMMFMVRRLRELCIR